MSPALAIVVCIHYPGARLDPLLARLGERTDGASELIVVLDGVTIDEDERVREWAEADPRARVVEAAAPHGVARARNLAIANLRSDYVWFVDDDDEWSAHACAHIIDSLGSLPDVLVFRAVYEYAPGRTRHADGLATRRRLGRDQVARLMLDGAVHGFLWSKVFSRAVIDDDVFPDQSSQSDIVGVARMIARSSVIEFDPAVLYTYRHRVGSITRTRSQQLGNLRAAHDAVRASLEGFVKRSDADVFEAWFLCLAFPRTVVRQGMDLESVRDDLADVQRRARRIAASRGVARRRTGLWVAMCALAVSPRATVHALSAAYRVLDSTRRVRARLR